MRATNLWSSELPFGQAQNQAYGYLFPHGAFFLLGHTLGVTPVPLGMPEVYLALKTGTVDGQENPLSILSAAKFEPQ